MADVPLMNNPMTTAGDIIQGGASGAPQRLAIGTAGQVLKVNAGATALEYDDESGGSSLAADGTRQTAGSYTTPGSTYADIDGTNLSRTISTGAHRVKVTLTGFFTVNVNNLISIDVLVDGTGLGGNGAWVYRGHSVGGETVTFTYVTAQLTAASHTIKLQWKDNGASGTLNTAGSPTIFLVEELPF